MGGCCCTSICNCGHKLCEGLTCCCTSIGDCIQKSCCCPGCFGQREDGSDKVFGEVLCEGLECCCASIDNCGHKLCEGLTCCCTSLRDCGYKVLCCPGLCGKNEENGEDLVLSDHVCGAAEACCGACGA